LLCVLGAWGWLSVPLGIPLMIIFCCFDD